MNFQEFCKAAGAGKPTQGLGYAYNYAAAMTQALEDSFGDEPVHFSIRNGACEVTLSTDLLEINKDILQPILAALKMADHFAMSQAKDEVVLTATFRV